jgi:hypothetical protein
MHVLLKHVCYMDANIQADSHRHRALLKNYDGSI